MNYVFKSAESKSRWVLWELAGHRYMVDKVLSGFSAHCYAVARVFGQLLGGCLLIQVECPPLSLYDILMGLLLNSSLKDFFHLL